MKKQYSIVEAFCSPQGEGVRAGTINVFLRFAGCNLACEKKENPDPEVPSEHFDCDTYFNSGIKKTKEGILEYCEIVSNRNCKNIIFTGGEPGLQLDHELMGFLKGKGYFLAIETNGTVNIDSLGLDWVTVSPKVAEHALKQLAANEVKYVLTYGAALPKTRVSASHYLLSPAFDGSNLDKMTLDWCIQLCKENPPWRLSPQMHKLWKVL